MCHRLSSSAWVETAEHMYLGLLWSCQTKIFCLSGLHKLIKYNLSEKYEIEHGCSVTEYFHWPCSCLTGKTDHEPDLLFADCCRLVRKFLQHFEGESFDEMIHPELMGDLLVGIHRLLGWIAKRLKVNCTSKLHENWMASSKTNGVYSRSFERRRQNEQVKLSTALKSYLLQVIPDFSY